MRSTWKPGALAVLLLLTLLLSASFVLSACSDDGGTAGTIGTETTAAENGSGSEDDGSSGGSSSEELPDPGMHEQEDGTVQAVGILTFRDLEGGFWAVVAYEGPDRSRRCRHRGRTGTQRRDPRAYHLLRRQVRERNRNPQRRQRLPGGSLRGDADHRDHHRPERRGVAAGPGRCMRPVRRAAAPLVRASSGADRRPGPGVCRPGQVQYSR